MGLIGPVKEVTHFQAQLWTNHTSMKEAYARNYNDICIETEHDESFRILRRQSFEEASREGIVKSVQAINACNPLTPLPYEPTCRIYTIFEGRNQLARFLAFKGLHTCSEIVNVDLSLSGLREILEDDIGWGHNLEANEIHPNFGRGEVIDGPKPKRKKMIKITEQEYPALKKLADKVDLMEKQLNSQRVHMGVQDEAFKIRPDPVFAIKYELSNKGVTISESTSVVQDSQSVGPTHAQKDKGKDKMFKEDYVIPDSMPSQKEVPNVKYVHFLSNQSLVYSADTSKDMKIPTVLESSLVQKKNAGTQVDEEML